MAPINSTVAPSNIAKFSGSRKNSIKLVIISGKAWAKLTKISGMASQTALSRDFAPSRMILQFSLSCNTDKILSMMVGSSCKSEVIRTGIAWITDNIRDTAPSRTACMLSGFVRTSTIFPIISGNFWAKTGSTSPMAWVKLENRVTNTFMTSSSRVPFESSSAMAFIKSTARLMTCGINSGSALMAPSKTDLKSLSPKFRIVGSFSMARDTICESVSATVSPILSRSPFASRMPFVNIPSMSTPSPPMS